MKSSELGWLGVVVLAALAGYVFYPVGQQIAHGMANGEPFQGGRPESYWIEALNCNDQNARVAAIDALARMGPRVIPDLIKKGQDPKFYGRADVYEALAKMGEPAVPALVEVVKNDRASWGTCQPTFAKIGAPAVPPMIELLKGEDTGLQAFAAGVISQMGERGADALPALMEGVRESKETRGPKAKGPTLPSTVIDPSGNFSVRSLYVAAIGKLGPKGKPAIPLLLELIRGQNKAIAIVAMDALGDIGPDAAEAVPTLIDVVKTAPNFGIVLVSARALGKIGPPAKAAVPELMKYVEKPQKSEVEQSAKEAVKQAIKQIDPEFAQQHKIE
jgi:HEAT repeat protein